MVCIAQNLQDGPNHRSFDFYSPDQLFESGPALAGSFSFFFLSFSERVPLHCH